MKLLILHQPEESIVDIANIFDSTRQVDPYEQELSQDYAHVMHNYGHILKPLNVSPDASMESIVDILNNWFDHEDHSLFFSENNKLKKMTVTNPDGKYYKWGIDYESLKTFNDDYVETINIENWDCKGQYREEYEQSLYYWKGHPVEGVIADTVALYDAMCSMMPHAIIAHGKWIQGPPLDIFDMDLVGYNLPKMKSDMHVWIRQIISVINAYSMPPMITSIYYK